MTEPVLRRAWRPRIAALASLGSAALVGLALWSPSFWVGAADGTAYRVGLLRAQVCVATACRDGGLALFGSDAVTWGRLGAATFAAGALALAAQLLAAVMVLRGGGRLYRPRVAGWMSLFAFSLAAAFVVAQPGLSLAAGPALVGFFAGATLGVSAGLVVHERRIEAGG